MPTRPVDPWSGEAPRASAASGLSAPCRGSAERWHARRSAPREAGQRRRFACSQPSLTAAVRACLEVCLPRHTREAFHTGDEAIRWNVRAATGADDPLPYFRGATIVPEVRLETDPGESCISVGVG